MKYQADIYTGDGNHTWGVYCRASNTWQFPTIKGKRGAKALARRLNKAEQSAAGCSTR